MIKKFAGDDRTEEQIREHYQLEKKLAARLRNSARDERISLYSQVYEELYSSLPHHPRHTQSQSPQQINAHVEAQLFVLRPFLKTAYTVLEVGPGACHSLRAVAGHVRRAIGVEVAVSSAAREEFPPNLELLQFDGINIPLPAESVDLVYSMAVMEHLHPDDAVEQLRGIVRVLKPSGLYVFYTPHRYKGPGDISKYFDDVATCFHLKEWTCRELNSAMKRAGFAEVLDIVYFKGETRMISVGWAILLEGIIRVFPRVRRRRILAYWAVNRLLNIQLLGRK